MSTIQKEPRASMEKCSGCPYLMEFKDSCCECKLAYMQIDLNCIYKYKSQVEYGKAFEKFKEAAVLAKCDNNFKN